MWSTVAFVASSVRGWGEQMIALRVFSVERAMQQTVDSGNVAEIRSMALLAEYVIGAEALGLTDAERSQLGPNWPHSQLEGERRLDLAEGSFRVPARAFNREFRRILEGALSR